MPLDAPATANISLLPATIPSRCVVFFGNHRTLQMPLSLSPCVATLVRVSTDQTLHLLLKSPESRYSPLWLNDKLVTHALWPERFASVSPLVVE